MRYNLYVNGKIRAWHYNAVGMYAFENGQCSWELRNGLEAFKELYPNYIEKYEDENECIQA